MRYLCLLAVLSLLPVTATAQQHRRSEQRRSDHQQQRDHSTQQQRPTSFLSPIGLPPAPQTALPSWERQQTPWWERQGPPSWERQQPTPSQTLNPARTILNQRSFNPARDILNERGVGITGSSGKGHRGRRTAPPPVVYVLPPYRFFPSASIYGYEVNSGYGAPGYVAPQVVSTPAPPPPEITTGFLKLEVEPRNSLQVFVDGYYLGTLADLGDEIELRLGARRIELRAPGYRTLVFDTEIVADRTVVYRGALEAMAGAPATPVSPIAVKPAAPTGSRTIYVVPGCYMGNIAPTASDMRPGCDIKKLSKIEP